ncbi:MAG TPA: YdeI/OmpD-associated family protein [Fulvivirga sp.]|nr:YdeI/OmpD-associated family protein [Fulvivirga sp.]
MNKVNGEYLLQKFPGKGGWTYAAIPEIPQDRKSPFGWVRVNGHIDTYELKKYKLMPMGNGQLFLPVKADIRRKIGKQAGDFVTIILELDQSTLEVPEEIIDCFKNEPKQTYANFMAFNQNEQKLYLDWIYDAKTEDTKAARIVKMMDRVQYNKRFFEA